jgi:hypothetical protein
MTFHRTVCQVSLMVSFYHVHRHDKGQGSPENLTMPDRGREVFLSWPKNAIHATISWFSFNNPKGLSLQSHRYSSGCVYSARTGFVTDLDSDSGCQVRFRDSLKCTPHPSEPASC